MKTALQTLSIFLVIAVTAPILYWLIAYEDFRQKNDWPASKTNVNSEWFTMADVKRDWNLKPVNAEDWKLIVNFWSFETFNTDVFVALKITDAGKGFVTVKSRASEYDGYADLLIINELENVPVSVSKLDELNNIFQETRYWAFPPSGSNRPCIDGWGYLLETIRGDDVRSWINMCGVSPEMERIGEHMLSLTPHAY